MEDDSTTEISGSEQNTGEELKIEFRESDDYRIYPGSSVRGGIQLSGDYLFEFLIERYEDPQAEVYSITSEGDIGEHVRNESFDGAIVREKQAGVQMSQSNAFNVATWTISNLLGEEVTEEDVEEVIIDEFEDHIPGDSE